MREIGSRKELFVDDWLIDRLRGAKRVLHSPERREVVLEMTSPAESPGSCYFNFFEDHGQIHLYYRGVTEGGDDNPAQTANLALSDDGIHFVRPEFGLYDCGGSTANNIVYRGIDAHNFCVFRDDNPACTPDERYKAVGGAWEKLRGFVSPDGIRWRSIREEPLDCKGTFDSLNVVYWDTAMRCYRMFSRYFTEGTWIRCIQSCTSQDFIHWTDPVPHDYGPGEPLEQYYTNATVPCPGAEHILLSFPKRFMPTRQKEITGMSDPAEGVSDATFMASRDGVHWQRFREAWVRPGSDPRNWTHRGNMVARGIYARPAEWSLYISEHYSWPTSRLRRLSIRPYGFVSLHGDFAGGTAVTHPLVFDGARLYLNYATSGAGSLRVELQDAHGKALPGFRLRDMAPLYGDSLDDAVTWKQGGDLTALRGQPIRVKFELKDADVFAIQFR